MKIILIGNNEHINEKVIESLDIKDSDIIILFNHMYPLKFEKIRKHKNLVCVLRFRATKENMTGFREYYNNSLLFKKVLIYYVSNLNRKHRKILDNYKRYIEKDKLVDYTSTYKKAINKFKINYPSGSSCTTGFSIVLYLLYKNINSINDIKQEIDIVPIDIKNISNLILDDQINSIITLDNKLDLFNYEKEKIILVGFTGIYNGTILKSFHRCDFEQEFYNKILQKKIIKKIDTKQKSQKILVNNFKKVIKKPNIILKNIKKIKVKIKK